MTTEQKKIITRFAPSPTGHLHIGGVRTCLYNYLFARKHGGTFILRIEDTDKERSKKEYEESILESLAWLGLGHDALYRQSEHTAAYRGYIERLIESGHAYVSSEEAKDQPGVMRDIIRFRNPNKKVTVNDLVVGEVVVDTTDLGDFVIAKDLDTPIFHLANVIDDHEMGVTHIIRAQEHLANTPRQILIAEAIGAAPFTYAHIPLVLAPDKSKLSKRHGAVSALEFRDQGYLPEAVLNFLALIGWNPGTEQEIFSKEELVEAFSLEKVQKGGAVFNTEKLDWVNKEHIRRLPPHAVLAGLAAFMPEDVRRLPQCTNERLEAVLPLLLERISKFGDIAAMAEAGEIQYFFSQPDYDPARLLWKKEDTPESRSAAKSRLEAVKDLVASLPEKVTAEAAKEAVWPYAEEQGRGDVLWPTRVALSGRDKSPDPFSLMAAFGTQETISRLTVAIQKLS